MPRHQEQMGWCVKALPDLDHLHADLGVLGGLTRLDNRKAKPTYADVAKGDMCLYPQAGEEPFADQVRIIMCAKSLQPSGKKARSSRHQQQPTAQVCLDMTTQDAATQDTRSKSRESSQRLSTFRRKEQLQVCCQPLCILTLWRIQSRHRNRVSVSPRLWSIYSYHCHGFAHLTGTMPMWLQRLHSLHWTMATEWFIDHWHCCLVVCQTMCSFTMHCLF